MPTPDGTKENPIPLPDGFVELSVDSQSRHTGAFTLYTRPNASAKWTLFKEGPLQDTAWTVEAKLLKPGLKYAFAWVPAGEPFRAGIIVDPTKDGGPAQAPVKAKDTQGLTDGIVEFS